MHGMRERLTVRHMITTDEQDLAFAGIAGQSELLREREVSARELTELCLRRIEALDGRLNAFRCVRTERALEEADAADARIAAGESGPLLGVPIAVKDNMDIAGELTCHGTAAVSRPAEADAEVVRRVRAAGGVMVGKTNMPELAMWPFTQSETYGPTRNPWNPERASGGSTGGGGAAVAAGLAAAALGSDGGGSIRVPSALCGLVGIKPQYGRVPLAPETDHWHGMTSFGPIARTVLDAAVLLDVLAGAQPGGAFADAARRDPDRLRIGLAPKPSLPVRLNKAWRGALESTAELLRSLGHEVTDAQPRYPEMTSLFSPRWLAGVVDDAERLDDPDKLERRSKRMLRAGRMLHGRALQRSLRRKAAVSARLGEPFERVDVVITPGVAHPAPPAERWSKTGALRTFNACTPIACYTVPWNYTGQPAAMVPAGFDDDGMPLSVQLVGRPDDERTLISLAAQVERARPWADKRPPVS